MISPKLQSSKSYCLGTYENKKMEYLNRKCCTKNTLPSIATVKDHLLSHKISYLPGFNLRIFFFTY